MDHEHDDDSEPEVQTGSEIETATYAAVNEDLEEDGVRNEVTSDEAEPDANEPSELDDDEGDTI
jgi:hypothetical protein